MNRCFVRTKFNLSQSAETKNVKSLYLDKNSEVINCIKKKSTHRIRNLKDFLQRIYFSLN